MIRIQGGLTRKIGLPRYSSAQASLSIDAEFDAALLHDPARLADAIRELYRICEEAVGEELSRIEGEAAHTEDPLERPASPAQLRFIRSLARGRRINLGAFLGARFGHADETLLTTRQAREVIDEVSSRSFEPPREHADNGRHAPLAVAGES